MTTLIPDALFNGRLIVKPRAKREEKSGSVVIPGIANSNLEEGIVLKVASDINSQIQEGDPTIEIGDVVLYPEKVGIGQFFNGDPCLWLKKEDIWGNYKPAE